MSFNRFSIFAWDWRTLTLDRIYNRCQQDERNVSEEIYSPGRTERHPPTVDRISSAMKTSDSCE